MCCRPPGAAFPGRLNGQFNGLHIELLKGFLDVDGLQRWSMGLIGASHDHDGPCNNEFLVQHLVRLGIIENRLGGEGVGLLQPPAFQFENLTFR